MRLKLDLHVHTRYSPDGFTDVPEVVRCAKKAGLDGVAVTDHDRCDAIPEALEIAKREKFIVIPGIEVKSRHGDILGLGLSKPVRRGMSARDTVSRIHEMGGVAVAAHPYSFVFHPCGVRGDVRTAGFDAVEVFNSRTYFSNGMAVRAAKECGLSVVASSDAHLPGEIGNSYTVVDSKKRDAASILDAIRNGKTEVFCTLTPLSSILGWYLKRFVRLF